MWSRKQLESGQPGGVGGHAAAELAVGPAASRGPAGTGGGAGGGQGGQPGAGGNGGGIGGGQGGQAGGAFNVGPASQDVLVTYCINLLTNPAGTSAAAQDNCATFLLYLQGFWPRPEQQRPDLAAA